MADFFSLYDSIIDAVPPGSVVTETCLGERWAMAFQKNSAAVAMFTPGSSIPPLFSQGLCGMEVRQAAAGVKSWNFEEASMALAAVNSALNTPERVKALHAEDSMDRYYTHGLDFRGKTVGLIGHLNGPPEMRREAKTVYTLEKQPQPGDYPDSACDLLLPRCDIVIITGSALINKTLPHLLDLCRNAYTILTGPSVPLCPALLEQGLDRIAGMVVTDREGMKNSVLSGQRGNPYRYGEPFLLVK
ncbi:MAG: DUF364 domain-containing protein [Clostridiales bacterium]|nr:DUF364 domain-containing protein [Clostridiales bacterium]